VRAKKKDAVRVALTIRTAESGGNSRGILVLFTKCIVNRKSIDSSRYEQELIGGKLTPQQKT
jgi:hypothetical protein